MIFILITYYDFYNVIIFLDEVNDTIYVEGLTSDIIKADLCKVFEEIGPIKVNKWNTKYINYHECFPFLDW